MIDALARFIWRFDDTDNGTTITQRASLSGERSAEFAAEMGPLLETGLPEGMEKLRAAMEKAALDYSARSASEG